ncbi:aldose epimerase family protein [Micromonospora sp. CPCC 206060]|uniref:aldose epimerase family protein n=1 Tax=Micromonospora sp. CPCC 206060 TaxID=3122406 RepID=UPI002FEF2F6F
MDTGGSLRISRAAVGETAASGSAGAVQVDEYLLDTGRDLAIAVWTYGATLVQVIVPDRYGNPDNVVLRLPDLSAYEDRSRNPYVGCTVGRYCRSVADGRFRLDGVEHHLHRNDGRHHVHGGPEGFDRRVWAAEAGRDGDDLVLHLRLDSPDGDQGYPGAVTVQATYRVDGSGRLSFEYRAETTASTIVSLTNHAFWNLSAGGVVDGHVLALNAARVLRFDAELMPVAGPPADVVEAGLDFRRPRTIGATKLDNLFVPESGDWAAELADPVSGRCMRVVTDQPGLGVYSGDGYVQPRAGICLEAGGWPNSPNRPDFPSDRLDPGEVHIHRTTHQFSVGHTGAMTAGAPGPQVRG